MDNDKRGIGRQVRDAVFPEFRGGLGGTAREKAGNALSAITGFGALKAVVANSFSGLGGGMRHVRTLFRRRPGPVQERNLDPAEGFRIAAAHYAHTPASLARLEADANRTGWLWSYGLLATTTACILSGRALVDAHGVAIAAATVTGSMSLVGSYWLRAAHGAWQVRTRRLGSLCKFLRQPGEWLPPSGLSKGAGLGVIAALVGAGSMMMPQAAQAFNMLTELDLSAVPRSDIPGQFLGALWTPSVFGLSVNSISVLVFSLGAFSLGWWTVVGMVNSAHEGEVLGRRYHKTWAPLRVVIGVGLAAPITHLTGGQMAVLTLAATGHNVATDLAVVGAQRHLDGGKDAAYAGDQTGPKSARGEAVRLAVAVLRAETCVDYWQVQRAEAEASPYRRPTTLASLSGRRIEYPSAPPVNGAEVDGGKAVVWDYGACGRITLDMSASRQLSPASGNPDRLSAAELEEQRKATRSAAATFLAVQRTSISEIVQGIRASGIPGLLNPWRAQGMSNDAYWAQMRSLNVVDKAMPLVTVYETKMTNAGQVFYATRYQELNNRLVNSVESLGWPAYFSVYMPMQQAGTAREQISGNQADIRSENFSFRQRQMEDVQHVQELLATLDARLKDEMMAVLSPLNTEDMAQVGDDASINPLTRLMAPMTRGLSMGFINLARANSDREIVTSVVDTGGNLLNVGWGILVGGTAASAASGNIGGKLFGAEAAFQWISTPIQILIAGLIFLGTMHSYVLPLAPYFAGMWAYIGTLVFTLEAIICVNLALLMWARFDGDELINGQQRPLIGFLFNLLIRPALIVIGFEAFMFALPWLLRPFNATFAATFVGSQGGSTMMLWGPMVGFAILTYVYWQAFTRTCALVTWVPAHCGRWLGVDTPNFGEHDDAKHSTSVVLGGISKAGGEARSAGSRLGTGGKVAAAAATTAASTAAADAASDIAGSGNADAVNERPSMQAHGGGNSGASDNNA